MIKVVNTDIMVVNVDKVIKIVIPLLEFLTGQRPTRGGEGGGGWAGVNPHSAHISLSSAFSFFVITFNILLLVLLNYLFKR